MRCGPICIASSCLCCAEREILMKLTALLFVVALIFLPAQSRSQEWGHWELRLVGYHQDGRPHYARVYCRDGRCYRPRRPDFVGLSFVIGTFIVTLRHGATAETRSTVAPLRRGARVGLTLSCDIIIRPVAETAGILRSPSTMLHPCLGKSSAPSQAEVGFRRVTKGAGALRLLKPVRHGRRPSTKHRSSCCIGLLRCATFTTVAAHS